MPVAAGADHGGFTIFAALRIAFCTFNTFFEGFAAGRGTRACRLILPLTTDAFTQSQAVAIVIAVGADGFKVACFTGGVAGFEGGVTCFFGLPLSADAFLESVTVAIVGAIVADGGIDALTLCGVANFRARTRLDGCIRPESGMIAFIEARTGAFESTGGAFGLGITRFCRGVTGFRGQACFFEDIGIIGADFKGIAIACGAVVADFGCLSDASISGARSFTHRAGLRALIFCNPFVAAANHDALLAV